MGSQVCLIPRPAGGPTVGRMPEFMAKTDTPSGAPGLAAWRAGPAGVATDQASEPGNYSAPCAGRADALGSCGSQHDAGLAAGARAPQPPQPGPRQSHWLASRPLSLALVSPVPVRL
jgi:hypothetical protein